MKHASRVKAAVVDKHWLD